MSPQKETWPQCHSERTYLYPFSATFANKCRIFKEHCGKKTQHRGQTSALKSEAKSCHVIKCAGSRRCRSGRRGAPCQTDMRCLLQLLLLLLLGDLSYYHALHHRTALAKPCICLHGGSHDNVGTRIHEGAPFTHRGERLSSNSRMQPPAGVKRENRLTSNAKSTEGRKNHEGMSITHWYTPLRCPHSPCQDPHDAVWPRGPSIAH